MKIWVIGSHGMLGSALLNLCRQKGVEVIGTSHREADITSLPQLIEQSRIILPTYIVNCAAHTDVDGAEKNPEIAYAINAKGAGNVAQAAKNSGARLIHLSTDYVFNGRRSQPCLEDDCCNPANVYGHSKREGELKVLEILPEACILRTSWLFGSKGKNFISSVVKWLREKEELQVVFDQCGKPTYCQDLAAAILTLLNVEGIVHFANDTERSRYEIALDIMEIAKAQGYLLKCQRIVAVSSAEFPTPAIRPGYTALDTNKYFRLTHQRPRPWSEVINEYLSHALSIYRT